MGMYSLTLRSLLTPAATVLLSALSACSVQVDLGDPLDGGVDASPDAIENFDGGIDSARDADAAHDAIARPRPTDPVSLHAPEDALLDNVRSASIRRVADTLFLMFRDGYDPYMQRLRLDGSPIDSRPIPFDTTSHESSMGTTTEHAVAVFRTPRFGPQYVSMNTAGEIQAGYLSDVCGVGVEWDIRGADTWMGRMSIATEGDRVVVAVLETAPHLAEPRAGEDFVPLLCVSEYEIVDGALARLRSATRELPEMPWNASADAELELGFTVTLHEGAVAALTSARGRLERWMPFDAEAPIALIAETSDITTLSNVAIDGERAFVAWGDWPERFTNGRLYGAWLDPGTWALAPEGVLDLGDNEHPHWYTSGRWADETRPTVRADEGTFVILPPPAFPVPSYRYATYARPETALRFVDRDGVRTEPTPSGGSLGFFDWVRDGVGGQLAVLADAPAVLDSASGPFTRTLRVAEREAGGEWRTIAESPSVALEDDFRESALTCGSDHCVAVLTGPRGVAATALRTGDGAVLGEVAVPMTTEFNRWRWNACAASDGHRSVVAWSTFTDTGHRVDARWFDGERWSDTDTLFSADLSYRYGPSESLPIACEFTEGELVVGYFDFQVGTAGRFVVFGGPGAGPFEARASVSISARISTPVFSASGPAGVAFVMKDGASGWLDSDGRLTFHGGRSNVLDVAARSDGAIDIAAFATATPSDGTNLGVSTLQPDGELGDARLVDVGVHRFRRAQIAQDGASLLVAYDRLGVVSEVYQSFLGDADPAGERAAFAGSIYDIVVLGDGSRAIVYRDHDAEAIPPESELRFRILAPGQIRVD